MRKAKSCSGCPAFSMNYCTLGYKTEVYEWWGGSIPLTRPVVCCNKPKTVKEYYDRLKTRLEDTLE